MRQITSKVASFVLAGAVTLATLAGIGLLAEIESAADLPVVLLPEVVITAPGSRLASDCGDAADKEARNHGIEAIAALPAPGTRCDMQDVSDGVPTEVAGSPARRFE